MHLTLRDAMHDVLQDWQDDLPLPWRAALAGVNLGFDCMDADLDLEVWEPIFPARRGRIFPGAPRDAHMLHAFDGIAPADVRCVVLGQDPYPCPAFATGRAFEAGNVAVWRELDKMFSVSVRVFIQQISAARTGDGSLAASFAQWPRLLRMIEEESLALEPPSAIADRWVASGVLLLNSSLTLSRFRVDVDPHQSRGHLPLWRPLIVAVLRHLLALGQPVVFIAFGDAAITALGEAGIPPDRAILRQHPARGDQVLALENPFMLCNRLLASRGATPILW